MALSIREAKILQMVADGFAHKEIGRLLGLHPTTIDNQMIAIKRRLGARNRTHAVVMAWAMGVIH